MESFAGGPAAGVEAVKFSGLRFVKDDEKIAAHSVHHGLDDADHGVRRHRCIDGIAALRQNHRAGLRGQGTFRRDDSAARDDHGTALRPALRVSCDSERHDGQEEEYRFSHVVGRKNI
jgi:hypothetical protein